MRRLFFLAAALSMASGAPAQAKERPVAIGYVAAFKGLDRIVERGGFKHYTHLNLSFVNPAIDGSIETRNGLACASAGDGTMISTQSLRGLVKRARKSGSKILVSIGGGVIPPCSGDWAKLLEPSARPKVVSGLVALVDRYGFDGVDVDLEGELMTRIDRAGNYTPFVRELSAALRARSKLLTAATATYEGGMVPDGSLPYFDLIGIMSYDAIGPSWGKAGDEHSSIEQARAHLAYWIGKGLPRERLALGLPFYGYGFGRYRSNYSIRDIAGEFGPEAIKSDVIGQRCAGCDYITFNGLHTLEEKARLAGSEGAGIMIWEIDQDMQGHRAIRKALDAHRRGLAIAKR